MGRAPNVSGGRVAPAIVLLSVGLVACVDGGTGSSAEPTATTAPTLRPGPEVSLNSIALLPPESGEPRWVGFDPTNRGFAGETHVKIGHGRNYQDVPPIRGVYRGPAAEHLEVAVKMRRINGDS